MEILTPDNIEDLTGIWSYQYDFIRRANIFFENIEGSTIDQADLDIMRGEMHFIRAWMYFDLTRHFGGVPLITASYSLADETYDVERATYDEVAAFVVDECDLAIGYLDGAPAQAGKASANAAMALKARMLLYAASALNNPSNDQSKWNAAEVATKAVLDAGFTLHPTHEDLFFQPIKADETIFGRTYTAETRIPDWGLNYDYWPSGFDARQRLSPTQTFINMFQMTNGEYPYLADGTTVNPASGYDPQNPHVDRDPRYY